METDEEIRLLNHQVHVLIHSKVDELNIQQNLNLKKNNTRNDQTNKFENKPEWSRRETTAGVFAICDNKEP